MTAGTEPAGGVRAALRAMPVPVAAAFVVLAAVSVAVMLLALLTGLLAEFAERLAGAGWVGAATLRGHYTNATSSGVPQGWSGPGSRPAP